MPPTRLNDVLDQDEVYVTKQPTGRNSNSIHLDRGCHYLQQKKSRVATKPAAAYPIGFHDICSACGPDEPLDGAD